MPRQDAGCHFVIIPELHHPHYGYELSTVWEGIAGVHGTNYFCGHDLELAIEYANDLNYENGLTPEKTTEVLESVWGIDVVTFFRA